MEVLTEWKEGRQVTAATIRLGAAVAVRSISGRNMPYLLFPHAGFERFETNSGGLRGVVVSSLTTSQRKRRLVVGVWLISARQTDHNGGTKFDHPQGRLVIEMR